MRLPRSVSTASGGPQRFAMACLAAALLAATTASPAAADTLAIVFPRTYSALETDKLYRGYLEHLARCTGASLTNHFGQPLAGRLHVAETVAEAQIPALLQAGRVHAALVPPAAAAWLEARGIAEPVAVRGQLSAQQPETSTMLLLARADSAFTAPAQLAGARIAFHGAKPVQPSTGMPVDESGAPLLEEMLGAAALAKAGLAAGKDYRAEHPGGHERALVGLQGGFWQAAFVAQDLFDRMAKKREVRERDFRVIWRSPPLPPESIVVAKSLPAADKAGISRCTLSHKFSPEQARLFEGSDGFLAAPAALYEPYRQLIR